MKDIRLVKIKTWEQMEREFGLDEDGYINCQNKFVENMERDLPKNRIILIKNDMWKNSEGFYDWNITDDMIEEELNPEDYPQYFI